MAEADVGSLHQLLSTLLHCLDIFVLFHVYECFACLYVHIPCAHLAPMEVRASMWMLGIKPRSSARAERTLNH